MNMHFEKSKIAFKPMLAGKAPSFDKIHYPILATPKIDGIRCLVIQGKAVSRTLKPIQNHYIRKTLEDSLSKNLSCLDGELTTLTSFQETASDVMSHDGMPFFKYKVFDAFNFAVPDETYTQRIVRLEELTLPSFCEKVLPVMITNAEELLRYEAQCLRDGYEGVMIRSPHSPYKMGRSTTKEGWLLKIKRFEDSDATIIGFEELMHNDNTAANMLGAFIVRDINTNRCFNIGTGFTDKIRIEVWYNKKNYINKIVKYKFQPYGVVNAPRCPVFLGFRDDIN